MTVEKDLETESGEKRSRVPSPFPVLRKIKEKLRTQ
jgi:hypothetical protein